jgi:hypothetical protein
MHSPSPSECFVAGVHKHLAPATERDKGGVPSSDSPEPEEDSERGLQVSDCHFLVGVPPLRG